MRFLVALTAVLIFATICFSASPGAADGSAPFRPGEKLTYEVRWQFVPAGLATLEVLPMKTINGAPAQHFVLTVRTNDFIDTFYKVRDRVDAFTDADVTRSVLYRKKQREGKHKRDITVAFDWEKSQVRYTNFGKAKRPVSLLPGSFDPLSVFYAFRFRHLKENTSLEAPVTDGKKCVIGKAQVLTKENIVTPSGTYETYLVEADMKDAAGVFKKSKDAKLLIWVSSDHRHIPVRIASKVAVGSFIAELTSIENNG